MYHQITADLFDDTFLLDQNKKHKLGTTNKTIYCSLFVQNNILFIKSYLKLLLSIQEFIY